MQFEDPRNILEAAAAKPERGIDPHALLRHGRRLRRARYGAVAAGLALTVAGASASMGVFGGRNRPDPVAGACEEGATNVLVFLRRDATEAEVQSLQRELEESPDVAAVDYTSPAAAADEFEALSAEAGSSAPPAANPAHFKVEAVDEDAARRLTELEDPAVYDVIPGPVGTECLVQTYCASQKPLVASIFLRDGTTEREALALRDDLVADAGIESVEYFSKHEAYDEFVQLYEGRPDLYQTIRPDDLPASLRVRAAEEAALDRIRGVDAPIVDEIRSSGDFYERLCGDGSEPEPAPTTAPEPTPSTAPEDGSGDEERRQARGLEGTLRAAECSLEPPASVDSQPDPSVKWCRFEVAIENRAASPVRLDWEARLRLVHDGEAPSFTTAMFHERLSPKLVDGTLDPGETVIEGLVFEVDALEIPIDLLVPFEEGRVTFELSYDCERDLRYEPYQRCAFGEREPDS